MKNMWMPVALALVLIFGQCAVIIVQANTIEQQRQLVKDMTKNPNCLIP